MLISSHLDGQFWENFAENVIARQEGTVIDPAKLIMQMFQIKLLLFQLLNSFLG
jgi:hypothetical protein